MGWDRGVEVGWRWWWWWWWGFRKPTPRRPCQTLLLRHFTARSDQRLLSNKLAAAPEIWHRHLASCWRHLRQLSVKNPAGPASPRSTAQNPPPHILVLHQFAGPLTALMSKERKKEEKKHRLFKAGCVIAHILHAFITSVFCLSSRFLAPQLFSTLVQDEPQSEREIAAYSLGVWGENKKEKVLEPVKPECKRMRGGE